MNKAHLTMAACVLGCLIMATLRAGNMAIEPAVLYCVLAVLLTLIFANSELR